MKCTLYNQRHGVSWCQAAVPRWSAWGRCGAIGHAARAGPVARAETAGSRRAAVRIEGQDNGLVKNLKKNNWLIFLNVILRGYFNSNLIIK